MPAVISYIQNQLFQELSGRPTTDQDESTLNTLITRISTIVHNKDLAKEASDHIRVMPDYIAIRPSEISKLLDMPEDQTRKTLNHPGCSRGQVRLQTGNKKCYKVFKDLLTNNVVKKLEEALNIGQVEEEEEEEEEAEDEEDMLDDELVFDRERPADRPAIVEEIDDDEEEQQQDPQPQQHQPQQPEPHLPEEPLPEIPKKGQQKRKTLTLLPLVVKKKPITNSQRSSSRSSKGVTSKLTDYYI